MKYIAQLELLYYLLFTAANKSRLKSVQFEWDFEYDYLEIINISFRP